MKTLNVQLVEFVESQLKTVPLALLGGVVESFVTERLVSLSVSEQLAFVSIDSQDSIFDLFWEYSKQFPSHEREFRTVWSKVEDLINTHRKGFYHSLKDSNLSADDLKIMIDMLEREYQRKTGYYEYAVERHAETQQHGDMIAFAKRNLNEYAELLKYYKQTVLELGEVYLDFFNNFGTKQGYADYYGLDVEQATQDINVGKEIYNRVFPNLDFEQPQW